MARAKATPENFAELVGGQVTDQITDAVTSAGNPEGNPESNEEPVLSASTLAEMEAGRAVLEKIAAMAPAPAESEPKTETE